MRERYTCALSIPFSFEIKMMKKVSLLVFASFTSVLNAEQVTPLDTLNAFKNKFGVTKGERRNHTKGMCFNGKFTATPQAKLYTKSPLFNGVSIDVIGRFSHAGGNPFALDNKSKVFGMSLKLSNGIQTHKMSMLNLPFFPVASPEDFVQRLKLTTPSENTGAIDKNKLNDFNHSRPSIGHLTHIIKKRKANFSSYANHYFNSIHTFYALNEKGLKHALRWRFNPSGDNLEYTQTTSDESLKEQTVKLIKTQYVSFDMHVEMPNASDPINDPTVQWVTTGNSINFGKLEILDVTKDCELINFDPNELSEGFEASDDKVLKFRSAAYAISFGRRLAEQ